MRPKRDASWNGSEIMGAIQCAMVRAENRLVQITAKDLRYLDAAPILSISSIIPLSYLHIWPAYPSIVHRYVPVWADRIVCLAPRNEFFVPSNINLSTSKHDDRIWVGMPGRSSSHDALRKDSNCSGTRYKGNRCSQNQVHDRIAGTAKANRIRKTD